MNFSSSPLTLLLSFKLTSADLQSARIRSGSAVLVCHAANVIARVDLLRVVNDDLVAALLPSVRKRTSEALIMPLDLAVGISRGQTGEHRLLPLVHELVGRSHDGLGHLQSRRGQWRRCRIVSGRSRNRRRKGNFGEENDENEWLSEVRIGRAWKRETATAGSSGQSRTDMEQVQIIAKNWFLCQSIFLITP